MNRFKKILETKAAGIICILISVACRTINILYVSFIGRDKIIVMQQSRNFLEGKGLSLTKYFTQNLDVPVYDFTPYWPPGYPILLSPFLKIFNYDTYWATTTVDILFAIVFIFLVRKIVTELNFPLVAINISTIIAGCFDYSFIYKSLPTDTSAFVIFLTGFLFFIRFIKTENIHPFNLFIASVLVFLPCTFRYSFPPLSIALPAGLMLLGWYLKKPVFVKKGAISLAIIMVLIISFFLFLKSSTGSTGYIVKTERGIFPENLLQWDPFIIESFINIIFTTSQLINKTGMSLTTALRLLETLNAILLITLVIVFFLLFLKRKFFSLSNPFSGFVWVGFFISAATCVSLAYLSLTYKPQLNWGNYLDESRYYMFVNLFLQITFVGWIFLTNAWKKSLFQKAVIFVFSVILSIELFHNIYFNTKVAANPSNYSVAPLEEPDYTYFISTMNSIARENPDADILVAADNDDFFPMMTSYLGHKGIYDGYNMLKALPPVKKKTIIILPLYDMELKNYESFLTVHKARFLNKVSYINFYRADLNP